MLIRDLPGLDPTMSQATGSLIETNIEDLVSEQMEARLDVEALQKSKEDKGGVHAAWCHLRGHYAHLLAI